MRGYVDHFETWQHGLRKKFEAHQAVAVELLIGVDMMEEAVKNADKEDKKYLKEAIKVLKEADDDHVANAVNWSLSDQMTTVMERCYDSDFGTTYPQVYPVEVERKRALFSTWYEFFPPLGGPRTGAARHLQRRATAATPGARDGLRRVVLSAHSSHRQEKPQRTQQRGNRPARRPRLVLGPSAPTRAATRPSIPSSAHWRILKP